MTAEQKIRPSLPELTISFFEEHGIQPVINETGQPIGRRIPLLCRMLELHFKIRGGQGGNAAKAYHDHESAAKLLKDFGIRVEYERTDEPMAARLITHESSNDWRSLWKMIIISGNPDGKYIGALQKYSLERNGKTSTNPIESYGLVSDGKKLFITFKIVNEPPA